MSSGACELAIRQLFDRDVGERILSKDGLGIEVHSHKAGRVDQLLDPRVHIYYIVYIVNNDNKTIYVHIWIKDIYHV